MFEFPSVHQAAVASQLATELADYDDGMRRLVCGRWDPELYRQLSDQFDRMQMYASALPRLSVSWTEFLISRAELTRALWTPSVPSHVNGRVIALHAQHAAIAGELMRKCMSYVSTAQ